MKVINPIKISTLIVRRSRTQTPTHANLLLNSEILPVFYFYVVVGITFDSNWIFAKDTMNIFSFIACSLGTKCHASKSFSTGYVLTTFFCSFSLSS